ncbi:MAG TPA: hypothetical protein VE135_10545 [Pyrinomonadaceae bacterium]|nr:hypothetical protein [Pyrinomonadaceae bacterium]
MKTKPFVRCALLFCFSLCLSSVIAQKELPEYGDIADLKGMAKVYVTADSTAARSLILDELEKYPALEVVSLVDDGQFVLECVQTGHLAVGGLIEELPTFEMTAYTIKDGRHRVAWSRTKSSIRPAAALLTRDFIKALKKLKR